MLDHLIALTPKEDMLPAPGKIEFTAYRKGRMLPGRGDDHMMWTVAIGNDHTATIYMHKDAYAELQKIGTE